MIGLSGLAKAYGAQTLFAGVTVQLNPGCRYGLVGANGSGKSTLLNILAGDEEPSEGTVAMPRRIKLGVLRQDQFLHEDMPIVEVAMRGHRVLWQALVEKEELLERADDSFDGERYAELEDIIVSNDGYAFEARTGEILEGLGIPTEIQRQPLSTLSGGFKLRVLLGQVLASEPDVLLLDEPTNHLDILSIRWMEKFLLDYPGCAVVVSHDHRFLDNVSTHILDVDYETITQYKGNYSHFEGAKKTERTRKEAEIAKREKEISNHERFVERFKAKATKARQAQSKVKQIEKTVIETLPPSSRRYPVFGFRQCRPSGKQALEARGVSKAFGDNRVLSDVSLRVMRGEKVAIIGPNGIGKSTLLKILTGRLDADQGEVEWGYETYPGYFAQDHREVLHDAAATVESWLSDVCPGQTVGFVRSQLGKVLFSGEEVEKKLPSLSGGEASRLILSRLSLEQPNVLILDEPTNHLDLEAIDALVGALSAYDGTLIFVSHDRWFVSRLATRVLEIKADEINDFQGSYDEYLERCGDDHLDADQAVLRLRRERNRRKATQRNRGRAGDDERRRRGQQAKKLARRRDAITASLEQTEMRVHEINELFCQPGFFDKTPAAKVKRLQAEQRDGSARVDELMAEWEQVEADLAELESES